MIRPSSKETALRIAIAAAGDFAIAWGALALLVLIRRSVHIAGTRSLLPAANLVLTPSNVLLFAGTFVVALGLSGYYRQRITPRTRHTLIAPLIIQLALVTLLGTALAQPLPRTVAFGVPIVEAIGFSLWRAMLRRAWPIRARDTILVGSDAEVTAAARALAEANDARVRVIAYILPSNLTDPYARAILRDAEEVIYVSHDDPRLRLELLRARGARGYLLLASHVDALLTSSVFGWIGDEPLIEVAVGCGYGVNAGLKRSIDLVVSALLILATAPLWLVVIAAIWLNDRRPMLIRQERVGRGNVPFFMWKFRTMRVGEETATFASERERVTRVGRQLRRYRLDELPQLLNVFVGDMSLVGPRPERPQLVERILIDVPDFDLRCLVRPGIAGLAQVHSEYETRPEVKLRYDLAYMCAWSLWLDIRLLLRSVSTSLSGGGI